MSAPRLSIILPNYNHAEFLPRCLEASLQQSFSDFEMIVIDDCSTDNSYEILQEYARNDSRIRLHRNEKNQGVVATLNRALGLARGDYVHGAAADDYILPGYYEAAMDMFAKYPQAAICLGQTRLVNGQGNLFEVVPGEWASERDYISPEELAGRMTMCGVPGPALWRRDVFLAAGGYLPELRWHCDWFALQVIAFRYGLCFLPEVVSVVRVVEDSFSNSPSREIERQREVLQVLLRNLQRPEYRDVVPLLAKSGIFRQFGYAVVHASLTMGGNFEGLVDLLKPHILPWASKLLKSPSAAIRTGAAEFLSHCGADGLPFDRQLTEMAQDRSAKVVATAQAAIVSIHSSVSFKTLVKHKIRRKIGPLMRRLDRFLRPLIHDRLEEQSRMLTDIVTHQTEVRNELLNQILILRASLDDAIKELGKAKSAEDRGVHRKAA